MITNIGMRLLVVFSSFYMGVSAGFVCQILRKA